MKTGWQGIEVELESPWIKRARADSARAGQCLQKGDPHEATSILLAIEAELVTTAQATGKITADIMISLYITWNSLVLAYKKYGEYMSCLKRLLKIHRLENLIGTTELENATTKMNLGTCCHFMDRPEDSLVHTNAARQTLETELASVKEYSSADVAYKKKLYLNLVLASFNRGVQMLAAGDEKSFRVNINQSLELATQKFGKDQAITQMIAANIGGKDSSELKPFFVAKHADPAELLMRAKGKVFSPSDIGLDITENRKSSPLNAKSKTKSSRVADSGFEQEVLPKLKNRSQSREGVQFEKKRNRANSNASEYSNGAEGGSGSSNRIRPTKLEPVSRGPNDDGKTVTFELPRENSIMADDISVSKGPGKEVHVQVVQAVHSNKYIQLAPIKNIVPKQVEMKSKGIETERQPIEAKTIPYGIWTGEEEEISNIKTTRARFVLRNMK